jgi:hypothetical protein
MEKEEEEEEEEEEELATKGPRQMNASLNVPCKDHLFQDRESLGDVFGFARDW